MSETVQDILYRTYYVKENLSEYRDSLCLKYTNIIDVIQRMHQYFYALKALKGYKGGSTIYGIYVNVGDMLSVWLLNLVLKIKISSHFNKRSRKEDGLIVSFTSFPARIDKIYLVVDSIIRQDVLPEKVILYLSIKQFPNRENNLPPKLLSMLSDFFEIRWTDDDLRSHKKYFYAFQDFPDKNVITIDDDSYYQRDMISRLVKMHNKYPYAICANWVHNIEVENDNVLPYRYWGRNFVYSEEPNFLYLAVGVGGVLYPAHSFDGTDLLNKDLIKQNAFNTDDLWLKVHEIIKRIPVVTNKFYAVPISIIGTQGYSLTSKNNDINSDSSGNDISWQKCNEVYDINKKIITLLGNKFQYL